MELKGDPLQEATPALFGHCKNVYDKMMQSAKRIEQDDGTHLIIYTGFLSNLIVHELNLSNPYYTFCTRALKEMGCVRAIRRGGGRTPAEWELITAPTEEMFNSIQKTQSPSEKARGRRGIASGQQQQINDLNRRLNIVEELVAKLIKGEING